MNLIRMVMERVSFTNSSIFNSKKISAYAVYAHIQVRNLNKQL